MGNDLITMPVEMTRAAVSPMAMILRTLPLFVLLFAWDAAFAETGTQAASVRDHAPVQIATGTVTGRFVVKGGGSMAGGRVLFYSAEPDPRNYVRVPNLITEIDSDGGFSAEIPAGKFYLGAIKRKLEKSVGKPREGDHYFRLRDEDGYGSKACFISAGEHMDFGILEAEAWGDGNLAARKALVRKKELDKGESYAPIDITAIEGSLVDADGNPLEDLLVFAFPTPYMQGRPPQFISNRSGKDGKYVLKVAGDQIYYLKARNATGGGQIKDGDFMGVYGEDAPIGVQVKAGEVVQGIDIRMYDLDKHFPRKLLAPDSVATPPETPQ